MSLGGEEAAVDLMMGRSRRRKMDDSGYLIRKMYKPDSGLHRGDPTRDVLRMKQRFTDTARADPQMRQHIVDMAGFRSSLHGSLAGFALRELPIGSCLARRVRAANHPQAQERMRELHQEPDRADGPTWS